MNQHHLNNLQKHVQALWLALLSTVSCYTLYDKARTIDEFIAQNKLNELFFLLVFFFFKQLQLIQLLLGGKQTSSECLHLSGFTKVDTRWQLTDNSKHHHVYTLALEQQSLFLEEISNTFKLFLYSLKSLQVAPRDPQRQSVYKLQNTYKL